MSSIIKVLSGVGVLIAIYLFLSQGKQTTNIINSIGTNGNKIIGTLQGRTVK